MTHNTLCKLTCSSLLASLVCLGVTFKAWSSESPAEELFDLTLHQLVSLKVSTPTKSNQTLSFSPANISVITQDDIARYGYQSLAQILQHAAGFIDNYDLAIHSFGVRGVNSGVRSGNRSIKVMLDGQPVSFRYSSQNFIDTELIAIKMIKRVEIIRGPVAALYGANALLGVVNLVTLSASDLADRGQLTTQYQTTQQAGSGQDWQLGFGIHTDKLDGMIALSHGEHDRSGVSLPKISPDQAQFTRQFSSQDQSQPLSLYSKVNYASDETSQMGINAWYSQLNSDQVFSDLNPLSQFAPSRIALYQGYLKTHWHKQINQQHQLQTSASYATGSTLSDDRTELNAAEHYLIRQMGFDGWDASLEWHWLPDSDQQLLIGLDRRNDQHQIETFQQINRQTGQSTPLSQPEQKSMANSGVYVQYQNRVGQNWQGLLGYRHDQDPVVGGQSSYRISLVGQAFDDWVVKLLAGTSFQTPSAELLYRNAVQSGDIIGNQSLSAQKASTLEVTASTQVNDYTHIALATYYNLIDDLVIFQSNGLNLLAENSTRSQSVGFELESRFIWNNWDAYLNFSYNHNRRDPPTESLLVFDDRRHGELYAPRLVNLGISYRWPAHKLVIAWNNNWVDQRPASTQNVSLAHQFYYLDAYWDSSVNLSWQLYRGHGQSLTLNAKIEDLWDEAYAHAGYGGIDFPTLGRRTKLGLSWTF